MNRSNSGANLPTLRSHNAALVLDLLRAAGECGISRLELAERTGLTPQAVSKITARLRAEGLAAGAGHRASTGGKPRTVLRLVPDAGYAVGLHLDRDELTAVLVDLSGAVAASRTAPLDLGAPADEVLAAATEAVTAVRAGAPGPGPGTGRCSGWASRSPARSTTGAGCCTASPGFRSGTAIRCGTRSRYGPGCPSSSTRTPMPPPSGSPCGRRAAATSRICTWGPGSAPGWSSAGRCIAGPGPRPVSSATRPSSWTGRSAAAGARLHRGALPRRGRPGDVAEAARVLGTGAANLVGLLDIDRVVLGGRTVAADPEAYVRGVRAVIDERAALGGIDAPVPVTAAGGGDRPVAEGAAQLILAPLFGRAGGTYGA